jgi:hypothetical protein
MLLETSLDCPKGAEEVRASVASTLEAGHRTGDLILAGEERETIGCKAMGQHVLAGLGDA